MQRSRYTHIAKQVFPYSQESTTGSLHNLSTVYNTTYLSRIDKHISIIGRNIFNIFITSNYSMELELGQPVFIKEVHGNIWKTGTID